MKIRSEKLKKKEKKEVEGADGSSLVFSTFPVATLQTALESFKNSSRSKKQIFPYLHCIIEKKVAFKD